MKKIVRSLALAAGAACIAAFAGPASAEFPDRPITLIVGSGAGGGTDTMARAIASSLEATLGVNVIVDNRGGAGGTVAVEYVRSRPSDGYTIGLTSATAFSMEPLRGRVDYEIEDFTYVGIPNDLGFVLLARGDNGYSDFSGLIERARAEGFLRYGTILPLDRTVMTIIARREGFELDIIGARGGRETRAALIAGDAEVVASGTSGLRLVASDENIIAVATLTSERLPAAPDLPTLTELGYELATPDHHVFFVMGQVPDAAASVLESAFSTAFQDEEIRALIERLGHQYNPRNASESESAIQKSRTAIEALLSEAE